MSVPAGSCLIDVRHLGRDRVIGCWDLGGVLVDPGPESCMEALLAGLGSEPRALLLTHIHLDHAGASGALVERFPTLEVWVHERGAPHLADPQKLLQSARRLYGDDMDRLWGRVVPVPEQNLRVLEGGETIETRGRELEVLYTPGHASHHVVYLDRADGTAYVGDVAGVRIPPSDHILAPTVPPEIDIPAWQQSIEVVEAHAPTRLALTHFGSTDDVEGHLRRMQDRLRAQADLARAIIERKGDDEELAMRSFVEQVERRTKLAADPETVAAYEQAASAELLWLGLRRYWEKQEAEGTASRSR
jgi:glyoxylase-like metal-dependent hydrolase (beta-lactamase superfamily II)